jgi:glutamyl-tRNA synthetase
MRGRFAPSPTGQLHLGNAMTALLSWLQVRAQGGAFLLRIEDLDSPRCRPELTDDLLRDLQYLGLNWDAPPVYQSTRHQAYQAALEQLRGEGLLYPCFCSRAEIARAASAPHGDSEEGPRYPGTCASLSVEAVKERSQRKRPALRFRAPPGQVHFEDGALGPYSQDVRERVGDFVVCRNDGVASYQLAVVVDDAQSEITDVLRGEDLLPSTARQLQLYAALRLSPPRFTHVPLLIGEDGKRLAKREGAFAISHLRTSGVPAEQVVGLLASWCGLHGGAPVLPKDLVSRFSLGRLRKTAIPVAEAELRRLLNP